MLSDQVLDERDFGHGGAGLAEMADWIVATARAGVLTGSRTAILQGHAPSVDRVADISDTLRIEFCIDPPGPPASTAAPPHPRDRSRMQRSRTGTMRTTTATGAPRTPASGAWFQSWRQAGKCDVRRASGGGALLEQERREMMGTCPVEVLEFSVAASGRSAANSVPRAGVIMAQPSRARN
ncbi:MAG: hypothetical protein OXH76_10270 [Boseongicola sp.]|nr:hypothetical protein [Boseongicola sp.]